MPPITRVKIKKRWSSKLKETIQKELGFSWMILIEQRTGIDFSSAHAED